MSDTKRNKRAPVPQSGEKPQQNPDSQPGAPAVCCAFDAMVGIDKLIPNPRNPNQHPPAQIALLAKVIVYQGWRAPIVVSKRSGFVVAGHGRLQAARILGLSEVPVDFQDFPSEADEHSHMISDNRLAELAESDEAVLRELLSELKSADFSMDLTGFDATALDALLTLPVDPEPPAEFPEADENIPTEYTCPKCRYAWSGKSG